MILGGVATEKVTLNFLNGTPYFLFHILVADVETFPNQCFEKIQSIFLKTCAKELLL